MGRGDRRGLFAGRAPDRAKHAGRASPHPRVVYANEGDFVFKPRNQWHTFWNAGDTPCRILEIISPSGFEHFFDELAELVAQPDFSPEKIIALGERYGHYFDLERTAAVVEEHGLHFPMPE